MNYKNQYVLKERKKMQRTSSNWGNTLPARAAMERPSLETERGSRKEKEGFFKPRITMKD